jgi:hypothetical protein
MTVYILASVHSYNNPLSSSLLHVLHTSDSPAVRRSPFSLRVDSFYALRRPVDGWIRNGSADGIAGVLGQCWQGSVALGWGIGWVLWVEMGGEFFVRC